MDSVRRCLPSSFTEFRKPLPSGMASKPSPRKDIITPALPGFTGDRPDGWGATMDDYAAWLIAELEAVGEPVDLVGHDWGGGFTVRLVSLRPDLVRSWVSDAAGLGDVDFEWHDFAKIWQTPGEGEAFWEGMLAVSPTDRSGALTASGVPEAEAIKAAEAITPAMAACILDLYRSATKVNEAWGRSSSTSRSRGW